MALKKLIESRKRTPISFDQILLITGQGNAKMIDLDELLEPAPQGMGAPKAEISDNQQLLPNSALSTNVS